MRKPNRESSGFTLIEMSVVLMILGILFMAFAPGYSLYLKDKRFRTTDARTDDIAAKMFEFRQMNGRYPCPASLTAPRGSATYGQESNCNTATGPTTAGVYVQNSVRSITARAPFSGTPKVIIGAVPFRALNIPEDSAYDANGARIVVAVTQGLTHIDAFRESEGAISIVNEQNKDFYAANVDPSLPASANPAASGHFVVISPGKTQIGAYSMAGALINPCTGSSADIRNCDYLPGATRQNTAVFNANSYSEGAGANFFDDIVKFDPGGAKTPWRFDTATGHNENDVVNMAADKVVLGPDTAANPLGDLSILATSTPSMYDGGMNVRGDLRAPWVCDQANTSNTTGCFRTADLLNQCPTGQYVTGFTDGVVRCSTVYIGCESGEYMEGMDGSGRPICKTIVTPRCGTAANSNWYNRPTTNMCTQTGPTTYFTVAQIGSTAVSSENGGQSQRWDWNCGKGSPGGGPNLTRTQSCTSRQMVDAVCGRLEGPYVAGYDWTGNYITVPNPAYPNPPPVPPATTSIPPTIQEREMVPYYGWSGTCQIGSGGSSWTRTLPTNPSWYCAGWNGGQGASCSYSPPPVNGRCGSSVNSCAAGDFQDVTDTSTTYLWNCAGRYGGSTDYCSSARPINGSCDNNTVNGCSSGTATGISSNGSYAYWTCTGSNGGSNSPQCQRAMACSAGPVDTPVNGSCNNLVVNGCARGSAINITSDASNDYWNCSGAFGGSNSGQCSKAKPAAPVTGICNNAVQNGCSSGTPNDGVIADTSSQFLWRCDGANGGGNSGQCSFNKPPAGVAGECNTATVNGCSVGSAINTSSDASNDYWTCSGTNGGANSPQCVKAKPPTAPTCTWKLGARAVGRVNDTWVSNYPTCPSNLGGPSFASIWSNFEVVDTGIACNQPAGYTCYITACTNVAPATWASCQGSGNIRVDHGFVCSCSDGSSPAPGPITGLCGDALNSCHAGSPINIWSDASNDYWTCSGTNGAYTNSNGSNSPQCVKAKSLGSTACLISTVTADEADMGWSGNGQVSKTCTTLNGNLVRWGGNTSGCTLLPISGGVSLDPGGLARGGQGDGCGFSGGTPSGCGTNDWYECASSTATNVWSCPMSKCQ